jgi:lipopolysaccharide export system permease protein
MEALKTAMLFLFCFWGLYVLIDYAHHSSLFRISGGSFDWKVFFIYYANDFVSKSELLVPLALLLGTIRVLCKLNEDNELVAMMASGTSAARLLRPFLLLGLLATGLMYARGELLLPYAANRLTYIIDSKSSRSDHNSSATEVQHLTLEDQSTLLYQRYDLSRGLFLNAYWIRSGNSIMRIKELLLDAVPPTGHLVDTFERNSDGALLLIDHHEQLAFPEMRFNDQMLKESVTPPEELSLVELWNKLPSGHYTESEKQARILSTFHQKIVFPWLCLLAVIAPAPFCMYFSRRFPVFLVYVGSLFGFMIIYITMNAAHVLGRRQLIDPLPATWVPFLLFALPAMWLFLRTRGK